MITNFNNNGSLDGLLRDFFNLTSMKICVYDHDGNELCYYPERLSPFCQSLRKNKRLDAKCIDCDKRATVKCRKSGEAMIYVCHAGLFEGLAPIVINGETVGFIAIGQIKGDSSVPSEYIGANQELQQKYDELPTIPQDKIYSALRILEACAGYEKLKEYLKDGTGSLEIRLEEFIERNIASELEVASLMNATSLSRSEIYEFCRHRYAMTPAELIKTRRLTKAAELLTSTDAKIADVAAKCGIPDYNYFSKVFKKHFDTSPREYRKNAK